MLCGSCSKANLATRTASTYASHIDILIREGDDLAEKGDYNGALVVYNMAVKHAPSNTAVLLNRSLALMLSSSPQLDLALEDADTAIQIDPAHWQGWQQKSEILQRMGEFQRAEDALVNAVGCARGVDRLAAQRSLVDLRARRGQSRQAPALPGTPVSSISPAPSSSIPTTSISGAPLNATLNVPQSPRRTSTVQLSGVHWRQFATRSRLILLTMFAQALVKFRRPPNPHSHVPTPNLR
jgi:tetratricopeptide (TPR) repeat protein